MIQLYLDVATEVGQAAGVTTAPAKEPVVEDSLQKLLDDGVIDDVRARLMSGKEASVFIVERKGEQVPDPYPRRRRANCREKHPVFPLFNQRHENIRRRRQEIRLA